MTSILILLLSSIALLHLLWAIGFWVPISDEAALARAVIGAKNVRKMPGAVPCALVAVAFGTLVWIIIRWPDGALHTLAMVLAAGIFIGRGVAAYLPVWRKITPEQPFARLDRRYYGPVCLVIGGLILAQL